VPTPQCTRVPTPHGIPPATPQCICKRRTNQSPAVMANSTCRPSTGRPDPRDTRGRRGVVVTGMHRSGTSALTRVINLFGMPLADASDLWLELPGNEAGYWESASLAHLNDQLLHEVEAAWWCPPPEGTLSRLVSSSAVIDQARTVFTTLHRTVGWVWKDPRTCLTLPLWRVALDDSFVGVIALRHPLEVAASLARRDGFPVDWSVALWERYTRSVVQAFEGLPALIVPHAALLKDPAGWCATTFDFLVGEQVLKEPDNAKRDEATQFLDNRLRHHECSEADLLIDPHVTAAQADLYFTLLHSAGPAEHFQPPDLPAESPSTERFFQEIRANRARDLPKQVRRRIAAGPYRNFGDLPSAQVSTTDGAQPGEAASDVLGATSSRLAPGWRRWIAENLMLRVADADILRIVEEGGVEARHANALLAEVRSDPIYEAGNWMAQRMAKLQSLLDIHAELARLRPSSERVERRIRPNREGFLQDFYARNEPAVLLGITDGWRAKTEWSPQYLKDHFGSVMVEVMAEREADAEYEVNCHRHKTLMRFCDYIDVVEQSDHSNDVYLVANNHLLERPELAPLLDDFIMPEEYLDPLQHAGHVFFWFGPRGTLTPLHHDVTNVLFVQVLGRKRFRLIPSLQTHRVYNDIGVFSQVDPDNVDLSLHPLFAEVQPLEFIVEPGEALFIPIGWWHQVESLDLSISLSFTNFAFPNDYQWEHPEIVR
jgi:Cupin-like domain